MTSKIQVQSWEDAITVANILRKANNEVFIMKEWIDGGEMYSVNIMYE